MKKNLLLSLFFISLLSSTIYAQDNVGIGTTSPNSNALLDLSVPNPSSTPLGLLLPRLTTGERTSMSLGAPENGLIVFDTDLDSLVLWNGAAWQVLEAGAGGSGDNLGNHTATTTLNLDGNPIINIDNLRMVGGGSASFIKKENTGSNIDAPMLSIEGANTVSGPSARKGGSVFIKGGQGFNSTVNFPVGGDVILESGGNLTTGTTNSGDIIFRVGGALNSATEIMRIEGNSQNIGIGIANPQDKLHVKGDLRIESIGGSELGVVKSDNFDGGNFLILAGTKNLTLGLGDNTGRFRFVDQGGIEIANITSDGRLALGLTGAATEVLDVDGGARIRGLGGSGNQMVTVNNAGVFSTAALPTDNQTLTFVGNTLGISGGNTVSLAALSDNLGNHTATQAIEMGNFNITGDGDPEGLKLGTTGNVFVGTGATPVDTDPEKLLEIRRDQTSATTLFVNNFLNSNGAIAELSLGNIDYAYEIQNYGPSTSTLDGFTLANRIVHRAPSDASGVLYWNEEDPFNWVVDGSERLEISSANITIGGNYTIPYSDGVTGEVLKMVAGGVADWGRPLSHFAEQRNNTGVNTSIPVHSLTAAGTGTNIDFVIRPKGNGAIIADIPDGGVAGGNKRGISAVDLQMIRSDPSEIASGDYSVIAGGEENGATGNYSVVGGGQVNLADNDHAGVFSGLENQASAEYSTILGGRDNQSASTYGGIVGGFQNIGELNTEYSFILTGDNNVLETGSEHSVILAGQDNAVDADFAAILSGSNNRTQGSYSAVLNGEGNTTFSYGEVVMGSFATTYTANSETTFDDADRLFTIGNGINNLGRSDALKIRKDGRMIFGDFSSYIARTTIAAPTGEDPIACYVNNTYKGGFRSNGGISVGTGANPPVDGILVNGETEFIDFVGIGKTNPTAQLDVEDEISTEMVEIRNTWTGGNEDVMDLTIRDPTLANANEFISFWFNNGSQIAGSVRGVNTIPFGVDYFSVSDQRLKTNFEEVDNSLSTISNIEVKEYAFKDAPESRTIGFLAQQLYTVYPQAVSLPDPDGPDDPKANPYMVAYGSLTPLLTKGIQELNKKVSEQEAIIQDLLQRIEALEASEGE